MIGHYLQLLDKPEWQLTTSDKMFIDVFPYLVMGAILILVFVIWYVVVDVRAWWKKRYKKKHPCKYCKRGHQCVGCPVKVVKDHRGKLVMCIPDNNAGKDKEANHD